MPKHFIRNLGAQRRYLVLTGSGGTAGRCIAYIATQNKRMVILARNLSEVLTSKQMMLVRLVCALAILMAFSTTSDPLLAKIWQSRPLGTILPNLSSSPIWM